MARKVALLLAMIGFLAGAVGWAGGLAGNHAEAAVNSFVWLNTVYKGTDPLLGGQVQAYRAGDNATLMLSMQNTTGETIKIRDARVRFDWTGGDYHASAGDYPASLANNESGTLKMSFTVPGTATAANLVRHSYSIYVDYEAEGGYSAGTTVERKNLGGVGTVWMLDSGPVDPATLHVFVNHAPSTAYKLDCYYGVGGARIVFDAAPPAGATVDVDYSQVELVGTGDGSQTRFVLDHWPVVPGTQKVYVNCALATAYSFDNDTGSIEFASPPAIGEYVIANYQYAARWTSAGDDFAVYSASQGTAMQVKQQLTAIGTPLLNTAGSRELASRSALEEQLGDQQYAAGNLDEAQVHYNQALTYMNSALKGDRDPNSFKAVEPAGTVLLGIGMVLLAFGVIAYVLFTPRMRP